MILYTCLTNTYYHIKNILNEDISDIYKCLIRDLNTCCKLDYFIKKCIIKFLTDLHRFLEQQTLNNTNNLNINIITDLRYYTYISDNILTNIDYYVFMLIDKKMYSDNIDIINKPLYYSNFFVEDKLTKYFISNKEYLKTFILNNKIPFHIIFFDNKNGCLSSSKNRMFKIDNNYSLLKNSILDVINKINYNDIDNYVIIEYTIKNQHT